MKRTMVKNLLRSIRRSFGRYIAIVAIIALGAGLFVGLLAAKTDMLHTGQIYMDQQNMFDLRFANTYGWSADELSKIGELEGVAQAEGIKMLDVLGTVDGQDGSQVFQVYGMPDEINQVYLLGGRMPQAADECLIDGMHRDDSVLGTTFTVAENNSQDVLDSLNVTEFTVVGYVNSPLFIDMTRGNTTLGNGSVSAFVYIPQETLDVDYYTYIDITIHGDYTVYSDEYESAVSKVSDDLERQVIQLAQDRYERIKAAAELEYADGLAQYNDGLAKYEAGKIFLDENYLKMIYPPSEIEKVKAEMQGKLEESRLELEDAWSKLDEARAEIDKIYPPDVYLLDRNTNAGYLALNNNSDIVAGVSKVFPVFFLLVAALVCITTMTRMVEEERTQIGTLKALGYGNLAIMSKYLLYAGSAAVLGCGFGVAVGSIIFPHIIWSGYSIIIALKPQLEIVFDIPLCIIVVATYTLTTLLVTWNCCRVSLRAVPAELIRPQAPASGKKILLEHIPFWEKFSFLNKVMWRNIFRYRQRLAMMLVGIGGCTALLVTGFGLGDSIMDIVQYQFEEVTVYDISAQFDSAVDDIKQQEFYAYVAEFAEDVGFVHQSSVEILFNDGIKNVYMIASEQDITSFFDLHSGKEKLRLPEPGEALISVGAAESMGISDGDVISVRNSDMQILDVKISGVFDNNVYNYILLHPQTVQDAWGEDIEYQVAFLNVYSAYDPQEVSASVSAYDDVLSVTVSQQMADQVGSMLDALNLIVVTVVICAALLAVIVIYNLTNINIKERLREIATIKVLGFNAWESAMYVFKENLILSVMGSGLGLVGGWFLLVFVMDQIKIDMVWFQARLLPTSLVWSVVITVMMAVVVDIILYFQLEKINMAEALKPVE